MSVGDTHEDLIIQGLRAREVRDWFSVLFIPVFMLFQSVMQGVMRSQPATAVLYLSAGVLTFSIGAWRLARGSVSLRSDRLVARNWNPYLIKTVEVPLSAVHKINLNGPVVRVGFTANGKAGHLRLRLMAPIAEELFDRLAEAVESIEANTGRVEHVSATREPASRQDL